MSIYGALFRRALYPAYEKWLRRRKTLDYLAEYEENQWLSPETVRDMQLEKLRDTLIHCEENVPYYRRLFADMGFDPREVDSLEALSDLPVLTRQTIKQNQDDLIDERLDPDSLLDYGTGGSTGEPLQFKLSRDFYERRMAGQFRGYRWAGWELGEKTLWFWGVSGSINPRPSGWRKRFKKWCYQKAFRNVVRTLYQFSDDKLNEYVRFWNDWEPHSVAGYAFGLYWVARYIDRHDLDVPPCEGVILAAEATTQQQRDLMARVFGAGVYNTYGSMEFNMIAGECDHHNGMHINCDNVLVEITRDGQPVAPGEEGEITVTSLVHPAMPFIRYTIGDRGVMAQEPCTCGRGYPLLKSVKGRTMDIVRTPEGNFVSGVWFNHTMLAIKEVKRWQVVQETTDKITMRIVPAEGYGPEVEDEVETQLCRALGEQIEIEFRVVDEVEFSSSGKYRVIISKVGISHKNAPAGSGGEGVE